jgi:hypothetical protein
LGKAIKSPLGLLPGLLLEAKNISNRGNTWSDAWAKTVKDSDKANIGTSNWEAFKHNINNPITALATGGKSIYDRLKNIL